MKFPDTIVELHVYNASHVTREMLDSLFGIFSEAAGVLNSKIKVVKTGVIELNRDDILYFIINAAGLRERVSQYPKYFVVYQLDQLLPTFRYLLDNVEYINILKRSLMSWDYNPGNVEVLHQEGVPNSIYVPVCYHKSLSSPLVLQDSYVYSDEKKEYDVVFLGWPTHYPRRVQILTKLVENDVNVGCWWTLGPDEMKEKILSAKIILNMRAIDIGRLETVRLAITLSNYACVVSERSADSTLDAEYEAGGVLFVGYDELVPTILKVLKDFDLRKSLAEKSFKWFAGRSLTALTNIQELLPL